MSPAPSPVPLVSPGTAGLLLGRVDQVEQRVEVEGTEEEKEDLLPKLVGLRKAISDMTEHYDAKLSEVKERNQQALAELKKLQNRVKCCHERAPSVAESPSGKENRRTQTPDNESADAPACCPPVQEVDNQGPLIVPQPHAMWEAYSPCCASAWTPEYGSEWHWWGPCGGPTCEAEFFPGVPWATVQAGSPCSPRSRSPVSFVPTPSPDLWSSPSKFSGSLLLAPLSPNRSADVVTDTVETLSPNRSATP
jgi:hypothetical protein